MKCFMLTLLIPCYQSDYREAPDDNYQEMTSDYNYQEMTSDYNYQEMTSDYNYKEITSDYNYTEKLPEGFFRHGRWGIFFTYEPVCTLACRKNGKFSGRMYGGVCRCYCPRVMSSSFLLIQFGMRQPNTVYSRKCMRKIILFILAGTGPLRR